MPQQFHRNIRATIGLGDSGVVVTDLRMSFEVRRSLLGGDVPNTCTLDIFNLSRDSRERMSEAPHKTLWLEVGYGSDSPVLHQIFTGHATAPIVHTHDDATWRSRILAMDSYVNRRNATISKSFAAGTPVQTILDAVAETFGLSLEIPPGDLDGIRSPLRPLALSGGSVEVLETLTKGYGLDWSPQDGVIEVSGPNSFYATTDVPEISPETGMIGSPIVMDEGVEVRCLLNPLIKVKRPVIIRSEAADLQVHELIARTVDDAPQLRDGAYGVAEVVHSGDTHGNDWTSTTKTYPFQGTVVTGSR